MLNQPNWQEAVSNLYKSDDLTLCPGSELLSSVEYEVSFNLFSDPIFFFFTMLRVHSFQICQSLRLRPQYYMSLKTNLILVIWWCNIVLQLN